MSLLQQENFEVIANANCASIKFLPFSFYSKRNHILVSPISCIIDSGASQHMTFNKGYFISFNMLPKAAFVKFPNSQTVKVTHLGSEKLFF